ncbi:MAG: phosphotransferase [Chitinophagaceae bacterium]
MYSIDFNTSKYFARFKTAECKFIYHHPEMHLEHCDDFIPFSNTENSIISKAKDAKGNFFAIKWLEKEQSLLIKDQLFAYHNYYNKVRPPFLIDAQWFADLVTVESRSNPNNNLDGIVMPWMNGDLLNNTIETLVAEKNTAKLSELYLQFAALVSAIKEEVNFVHGDLHSRNILVNSNNDLVLIDYNTSYTDVPAASKHDFNDSITLYHPKKVKYPYHINTDQFPGLCMLITLYAGSKDPKLVSTFLQPNGTIFSRGDLANFTLTPVFLSLKHLKDPHINNLLQLLQISLLKLDMEVPSLLHFISPDDAFNDSHEQTLADLLAEANDDHKEQIQNAVAKQKIIGETAKIITPAPTAEKEVKPENNSPVFKQKSRGKIMIITLPLLIVLLGAGAFFYYQETSLTDKEEAVINTKEKTSISAKPSAVVNNNTNMQTNDPVVPLIDSSEKVNAIDVENNIALAQKEAAGKIIEEQSEAKVKPNIEQRNDNDKTEEKVKVVLPEIKNSYRVSSSDSIQLVKPSFAKKNTKAVPKQAERNRVTFKKIDL